MRLWKSPILYIGILLAAAVSAALAGPHLVDWNAFRGDIEAYGRKLTGRAVTVGGPVEVRLFPWPRLGIARVAIANPPGASEPNLLTAERIDARMTLAGLFGGTIEIESIDIVKPSVALERLATGEGTWRLPLEVEKGMLDRVRLDRIAFSEGTLKLTDRRRGGSATFEGIAGTLSAPAVAGPWRLRAQAGEGEDRLDVALSTGVWSAGKPFRFGFRVFPAATRGLSYAIDGSTDGETFDGNLLIEPRRDADGKADAEGAVTPFVLKAKLVSTFDRIAFTGIEIAPADATDGGSLVTGDATIDLGKTIGFAAALKAPRFDLDAIAGEEARRIAGDGEALALVSEALDRLPVNLGGTLTLKVGALEAGGATLENAEMDLALNGEVLQIKELSARMPGQTDMSFTGWFFNDAEPQLAGDLAAEALNLREFVRWVRPEAGPLVAGHWTGSKGRLKLAARLDMQSSSLRASDIAFELDGAGGKGAVALTPGSMELTLDAAELDLDSFLPRGLAVTPENLSFLAAGFPSTRLRLDLAAKRLLLNGVEAHDARAAMTLGPDGVAIETVEIGEVGGARLAAAGRLKGGSAGPRGEIRADVGAAHPGGLLRLLGLVTADLDPPWLAALGKTAMTVRASVNSSESGPAGEFELKGTSGAYAVEGTLALAGSLDWRAAELSGALDVASSESAAIARLVGAVPHAAPESPAKVKLVASGSVTDGIVANLEATLYGAALSLEGRSAAMSSGLFAVTGNGTLKTSDASALFAAVGCGACPAGPLEFAANASYGDGRLSVTEIAGRSGTAPFTASLAAGGATPAQGEIAVERAELSRLLALAFLPWNGGAPSLESFFAGGLPLGIEGEFWVRPKTLAVAPGLDVPDAAVGVVAAKGERRLALSAKPADGRSIFFDVAGRSEGGETRFEGRIALPLELASLRRADGGGVAEGRVAVDTGFSGSGRTPAALLAALNGAGTYTLENVRWLGPDIAGFLGAARDALSQADVERATAMLAAGRALSLAGEGTITTVDGVASFLPVRVEADGTTLSFSPGADLAAGAITLPVRLDFPREVGLPAIEILHAGPPDELVRSIDANEASSAIGMRILKKGVAELERLQREQARLAAEEARQKAEDDARVAAWEAHRREMRLRLRELGVHAAMKAMEAKRRAEAFQANVPVWRAMNRVELRDKRRIQRAHRVAAVAAEATSALPDLGPLFGPEPEKLKTPRPRTKPKRALAAAPKPEPPGLPVVLVPPAEWPPQEPVRKKRPVFVPNNNR